MSQLMKQIERARIEALISWNDLAFYAGISRKAIHYWRKGLAAPTVPNLEAVANVLGYTLTLERLSADDPRIKTQ